MKFTDASAAALKLERGKTDRIEFDDQRPGLGVRVRVLAGGRLQRSWVVQLRVAGRTQRHDLGPVTATPARRAREQADEIFAKVRKGGDPKAEKTDKRDESKKTFGLLAAEYLAMKQKALRPRSYVELARHLERYFKRLDGLPARSVTGKHIDDELKRISSENGLIAGNRARRSLNALFVWALGKGRVDKNHVIGTDKPLEKEISRERVLTDSELKSIWAACGDDDHGRIIKFLMLTGQRRDEVGGIAESELQRKLRLWSLPRERVKNGKAHDVPLPPAALALLPAPRPGRDLLFGHGNGSFSGWSRCKTRLDKRIKNASPNGKGIAPWRLHDLRRTVASGMAKLGVNLPVIEKVLNHISGSFGGVVGVYQRHDFADEKRQALEAWAAHVEKLVAVDAGDNVVTFKGKGAAS
jgi:integrase